MSFSNYGPRTTCGPRDLPLWSFKIYRRKIKIQMNCISHYSWKSQSLKITYGNRLSFLLPVLTLFKFVTLPVYQLPTLLSATKEGFEALWTWYFPCTFGAAPVTQPGTTWIQNWGPKYRTFSCIYDILNVLLTPSLNIEMVTYYTSYTNNKTCQIIGIRVLREPTSDITRKSSKNALFFIINHFRHSSFIFLNHFLYSGHKFAIMR